MAMNPMALLKLKERKNIFQTQHPKFIPFLKAVKDSVGEGAILEMKVTSPEGKKMVTNIRLTPEDMETLKMLTEMRK